MLVGINLLRRLDNECGLVAILDADKEGFYDPKLRLFKRLVELHEMKVAE